MIPPLSHSSSQTLSGNNRSSYRLRLLTILVICCGCGAAADAQTDQSASPPAQTQTAVERTVVQTPRLQPGNPIEREIAGGQVHSYELPLSAGQYLHLVVDQRGIDLAVVVLDPAGKEVVEVDSPNGKVGPEPVLLVADEGGTWKVELRTFDKSAATGRYEIRIEALRAATDADRLTVKMEKTFAEALQFHIKGSAEALEKAVLKYMEAERLAREIGNQKRIAYALNQIGVIYSSRGALQDAVGRFQEALRICRGLGDRKCEVSALNSLGATYYNLGRTGQRAKQHRLGSRFAWRNSGGARLLSKGFGYRSCRE
jgi:tetratricopeptide (TPR) repeat protein